MILIKRFFCTFLLLSILQLFGCAYFNTFYNAQNYFEEAEKIRLEKEGYVIPVTAIDKYGKSIQKCQKVLSTYPDSRFKINATLLMAKSRFYRQDYDLALDNLKVVISEGSKSQIEEAQYWLAICKWKKGNAQTAIDELTQLLQLSKAKRIKSKCYLSLAEISNELKDSDSELSYLEKAAEFTKDRSEKGVIYGQLAEMSFERKNYVLAKNSYKNVIANSLSKEKVEEAHLQILKILRIEKDYKLAAKKIKAILTDDKFKRIAGNLELELVQLYKAQGEDSEIVTRLENITNEYQRTLVSAEAYYLLGQFYTSEKWELTKAKEYYNQVSKESSKSIFSPMAKKRVTSIDLYLEAEKEIEALKATVTNDTIPTLDAKNDSTIENNNPIDPDRELPKLFYQLADLEAFTFGRVYKGINYLEKIILDYPTSPFIGQSMFSMIFIYDQLGDKVKSDSVRNILLETLPNSEYASYISPESSNLINSQHNQYSLAEEQLSDQPENAIQLFKTIMNTKQNNTLSVLAAYQLGYYYDADAKVDSALKYFNWIIDNYPESPQYINAKQRAETLNFVLTTINGDTLNIKEEN
tara:strand:- start:1094 stop:2839 length:1746 start_codon:yes stop_codon:yes gene_type:complete